MRVRTARARWTAARRCVSAWRRWRPTDGLAGAFERLARERGYRGEESGEESDARVYALVYGVAPTLMAASMTGLAVRPISTTEAVVVSLREKILDGAIAPGAPLPEADLTRDFGVARPTVRAAIQTLCHEGLLKRERNRSAFIPRTRARRRPRPVLGPDPDRVPDRARGARARGPLGEVHAAISRLAELTVDSHWSEVVEPISASTTRSLAPSAARDWSGSISR